MGELNPAWSMEERPPEVPQPIPEIPKRALWLTLGIPPLIALLASVGLLISDGNDSVQLVAAFGCLLTTVAGLGQFDGLMARRYRGNSAVFLSWAYILGQFILCAALGVGVFVVGMLIEHASR